MNFEEAGRQLEGKRTRLAALHFKVNIVGYIDGIYTFVLKDFKGVREDLYALRCELEEDTLRFVLFSTENGAIIAANTFPNSDPETNIFNAIGYATSQILKYATDKWRNQ